LQVKCNHRHAVPTTTGSAVNHVSVPFDFGPQQLKIMHDLVTV